MATDPVTLAGWIVDAGWAGTDAIKATAIALRSGADPAPPRGIFLLGSSGDGAAQAAAGHALWAGRSRDWNVFPGHRDGAWQLYVPVAGPAVGAAQVGNVIGRAGDAVSGAAQTTFTGTANALESAGQIGGFLVSDKAWERIIKVTIGGGLVLISVAAIGKRLTFDQGTRFLRSVADYAGLILAARAGGARAPGAGGRSAGKAAAGKAAGEGGRKYTPKHRAKPAVRRADPQWNNAPTEPRPIVRYVGKAKPPPRPLPGESAKPRTQREKRSS